MCGIAGILGGAPSEPQILSAAQAIAHRGPDHLGRLRDGAMLLLHQRLSIQDLSAAGNQPFSCNGVHVIANGEIYNHPELRRELESGGAQYQSHSDCESILHGYLAWGLPKLCRRLRGMFAIAIWDGRSQELHLIRDRLGIKPLYYSCDHGHAAFASEIEALLRLSGQQRDIDPSARQEYLVHGYIAGDKSIWNGIHKLRPGHSITLRQAEAEAPRTYWQMPTPGSVNRSEEEIDSLLQEAVRSHLVSDRPVGCFLSGGIDSSLVSAYARKVHSGELKTFSVGFELNAYDESRHAAAIAQHIGSTHESIICSESDLLSRIDSLPRIYGEPFADSSALPTLLLSEFVRSKVVVALSGDGGDELCLGYTRYDLATKLERILKLPGRQWAGRALGAISPLGTKPSRIAGILQAKNFAEAALMPSGIFTRNRFHELTGQPLAVPDLYWARLFASIPASIGNEEAWSWVDVSHYMAEDILTKVDRASMQVALEVRVPLLDHVVAEALMSLPRDRKICGVRRKDILKRLLSRHVPRELWDRPKQGFGIPLKEWFRGPLRQRCQDLLTPTRVEAEGWRPDVVARLIQEHMSGIKDNSGFLWCLLMWVMWRDQSCRGS